MIAATLYRKGIQAETIDQDHLDQHCGHHDGVLWVDVSDSDGAELSHVAIEFALHPLALEGASQVGERPTMERFPTHSFIVIYDAMGSKVSLFFNDHWVVTVRDTNHNDDRWNPAHTAARFEARPTGGMNAAALVYEILDGLVDGHEEHVDRFVDEIETIEDRILNGGEASREIEKEVLHLRRRLITARRTIAPVRDVLQELRRGRNDAFDDPEIDLGLADVNDHLLRIIDQIDTHRDLLSSAFETHLAAMSNQMNLVMKQLSAWGAIALAATLIAGIYGMNFTHMPELQWYFGYPMALGMMAAVGFGLYRLFKTRGWL